MGLLANFQGFQNIPDEAIARDIGNFQGRRREAAQANELENSIRDSMGQAPLPTEGRPLPGQPGSGEGLLNNILNRLAPDVARAARDLDGTDPVAVAEFREQAQKGLALSGELKGMKHPARMQRIAQEAGEVSARGEDVSRLVDLANMTPEKLDLELQRMEMIGNGMQEAVPEYSPKDAFRFMSDPDRAGAFANIMATRPDIANQMLGQRDKLLASDERQRLASARAAAAAAAPKTDLIALQRKIDANVSAGIYDAEHGAGLMQAAIAKQTATPAFEGASPAGKETEDLINLQNRFPNSLDGENSTAVADFMSRAETETEDGSFTLTPGQTRYNGDGKIIARSDAETGEQFMITYGADGVTPVAQVSLETGEYSNIPDAMTQRQFTPVFNEDGVAVAQRSPDGEISSLPAAMSIPDAPFTDVFDEDGNLIAQRDPDTNEYTPISGTTPSTMNAKIAALMEPSANFPDGMERWRAVGLATGQFQFDTMSGELVDKATNRPVVEPDQSGGADLPTNSTTGVALTAIPEEAFGGAGWLTGLANTGLDTAGLELWDKNIEIARQDIRNVQLRTKAALSQLGGLRGTNAVLEMYEGIIPDQKKFFGGGKGARIQIDRVHDLIGRDVKTNDALLANRSTSRQLRSMAETANVMLKPILQDWQDIRTRMDMGATEASATGLSPTVEPMPPGAANNQRLLDIATREGVPAQDIWDRLSDGARAFLLREAQ